jgi:hypothetical protein
MTVHVSTLTATTRTVKHPTPDDPVDVDNADDIPIGESA